ncbi:glycosyltransferase family 39 protein [Streptomyces barringtoniae]|uniref:glycosyltransferase family 39 protein n=1 Tax=Streptomyces barringtoniae TaxID=2892029 RepID=UPI001E5C47A7|nr:glycosyltransferase family 39 protein [Streptomyces barringtoniae]MCC5477617.1 glycosyltransferase family 39 protein [Streptomyces barringtoniae]
MSTSSVPRPESAAPSRPLRPPTLPWITRRGIPEGALPALGLFAAVRLAGILLVILTNAVRGHPLVKNLAHSWDSRWYLHIAAQGYGHKIWITPQGAVQSDWAFFPLYPGLIRALTTVLPFTPGQAALLISWIAAGVAAYGVYAIGHLLYGRGVATALVALWAAMPHSVELTIAYTESLFAALAIWSLYCVLKGRWLWAGALAALAGLSRPSGFAVAGAVCIAAAYEVVRQRGRAPASVWAGAVLAPLGWLGYVLWVGSQTGDLLGGYFKVQSAWDSRFDFGVGSARFLKALLLHGGGAVYPAAVVIVAAGVLLFALLCLERAPLALVVFAGVLVLLVVGGSGSFSSKPRFLLPAFPLLIPMARALTRTWRVRPAHAVVVYAGLTAASLLFGAFVTVVAHSPL